MQATMKILISILIATQAAIIAAEAFGFIHWSPAALFAPTLAVIACSIIGFVLLAAIAIGFDLWCKLAELR